MNNIENTLKVVEMVMGVQVMASHRKRECVEARMVTASLLKDMGYSLVSIGCVLKKDHTTIIHYIRKLKDLIQVDKFLMKKYVRCKQLLFVKREPVDPSNEEDVKNELNRLHKQIEALRLELEIALDEKRSMMMDYAFSADKRLGRIYRIIDENTKPGYELIVERKILKLFQQ